MTVPIGNWNYRLVKDGEEFFVSEVYYNSNGRPTVYSEPASPYGNTLEELTADLEAFRKAWELPVLDATKDFAKQQGEYDYE